MDDKAEQGVSKFYNSLGWETDGETTEDAKRWEDLRECAREYVSKCRLRVLKHIPDHGENLLDMASGPIQYKEYLEYSKNFQRRYCVDLSSDALDRARKVIGDHGVFLHGSFFDLPMDKNFFDCSVSLHTIYHIDKDRQEDAVRKLVFVTKPGKPVIIVYTNPYALFPFLLHLPMRVVRKAIRTLKKMTGLQRNKEDINLYFHGHPLKWWDRFEDIATVTILPWRSFDADIQKRLFPDNATGKKMFGKLFDLEERFPDFFVKYFTYPMIILTKREESPSNPE